MSLKELAEQHHQEQAIPKQDLASFLTTIAIEDISGQTHVASSWFASMMISVRAAQRVLYQYRHRYGQWPYIRKCCIVSDHSLTMGDLLPLYYYSLGGLVVNGHSLTIEHYLKYQQQMPPPLTWTLVAMEKPYPCTPVLPFSDPTSITPVAAFCADMFEHFGIPNEDQPWPVTEIRVNRNICPFSGRDLQILRRFFPPNLKITCGYKRYHLSDLLPGGYQSHNTPFKTDTESLWQLVSKQDLYSYTGGEQTLTRMQKAVDIALQQNTFGLRRAAAAYTNKDRVISSTNVMIDATKGMPSCAETFALHKLQPQESVLALLLRIEDANGHLLTGSQASPCGFCRSHIIPFSRPDTPVIIAGEEEQFYMAQAHDLMPHILPQNQITATIEKPQNPGLYELAKYHAESMGMQVVVAECTDGDLILAGTLPNSYQDSRYPPTLAQRILLKKKSLKAILLYNPQEKQAPYVSPYLRMVLPTVAPDDCPLLLASVDGIIERTTIGALGIISVE